MAGHGGVGWEIVVVGVVLGNYGAFLVKVARCFLLRGGRGGAKSLRCDFFLRLLLCGVVWVSALCHGAGALFVEDT